LLAAVLLRAFVVQPFSIPSGSMEPTLKVHDRLLVNKLSYHLHRVGRGDIVVFKKPADDTTPGITDLVKRVIGLPGETISANDGQVYVDGRYLPEPWLPEVDQRGDRVPIRYPRLPALAPRIMPDPSGGVPHARRQSHRLHRFEGLRPGAGNTVHRASVHPGLAAVADRFPVARSGAS
jgi:signal peptidase I